MDEPFSGLDPLVREDLIDGLLESAGETTILISSHDLGEIESFASHIGYLDRGRLQFSEEMTSLTARFREVEVIVDSPPLLPLDRPVAGPLAASRNGARADPFRRDAFRSGADARGNPPACLARFAIFPRIPCRCGPSSSLWRASSRKRLKGESRCTRRCTFSRKTFAT